MSALTNPHDRYFKETFARPEIASDFLDNYLPPTVRAHLDLRSLALQKESFIDQELHQHFSDLLYQVQTVADERSYVYLLFEHKSYPDHLTIFQMLRYCVRIWEQALRADASLTRLPPIIPLLVYHGVKTWNAPLDMQDLLTGDKALHAYGPRFRCQLMDLSHWAEDEIRGEIQLQAVLLALRSVFDPKLGKEHLPRIFSLLKQLTEKESAVEYIQALLSYVGAASPHLTEDEVLEAIRETLSDEGDSIMPTIAEKYYQQGFEQGIEQGVEQGVEQGLEQGIEQGIERARSGALHTLFGLLEYRFGPVNVGLAEQIQTLTLNQIQTLSLIVLDASSIEQVAEQVDQLRG